MPDNEYGTTDYKDEDDKKLEAMGYVPSFKREFSNLATVRGPYPFFGRVTYGSRPFRSALPSALWYALRFAVLQAMPTDIDAKGLCSSVATTFNTPLLLGGPSSVRQHNTPHISTYDSNRMFSIGNVVLDPWSDHVFHVRRAKSSTFLLPYLDAAIQGHLLQKLLAPSPQQAVCA